ncbi:MAG: hypothetical protein Dbin4_02558 [Alphaproteobacteria bacterium]|nr:hypothetical protein [Alphaproteobacteria bacterium]
MRRVIRPRHAHRLAEYRLKHYLTQAEFAGLIGVGASDISGYESGKHRPKPEVMDKIMEVTKGFVKPKHFEGEP